MGGSSRPAPVYRFDNTPQALDYLSMLSPARRRQFNRRSSGMGPGGAYMLSKSLYEKGPIRERDPIDVDLGTRSMKRQRKRNRNFLSASNQMMMQQERFGKKTLLGE